VEFSILADVYNAVIRFCPTYMVKYIMVGNQWNIYVLSLNIIQPTNAPIVYYILD
jgi:hypothetical protein